MSSLGKISNDIKYIAILLLAALAVIWVYFFEGGNVSLYLILATVLGLYMAINIGSNDVANNMGPAVGSKAITISGAIIIAAIFEAAGVMIAGGDVVDTVKKGIINPDQIKDSVEFIAIMMSTLLGAALWVNIATILKAPVSTTHAVIGGLIGAGITSAGLGLEVNDWSLFITIIGIIIVFPLFIWLAMRFIKERTELLVGDIFKKNIRKKLDKDIEKGEIIFYILFGVFLIYLLKYGFHNAGLLIHNNSIVDWVQIGKIAASWVISPVMGGFISVILMLSIRKNILKKEDRGEAAKIWVPVYVGIMIWAFSTYIILKGLKNIVSVGKNEAFIIGLVFAVISVILLKLYFKRKSSLFKNSKKYINNLFNFPLIFSVALLSFAHGANDVANAIGPLAAINDAISSHGIAGVNAKIETWIMILGAMGLVAGLAIFGARLIKTVGNEITKLNQIRAYCVSLSAAITVILASQLGLPVSSTHIALGGVFGIGLMREHIKRQQGKDKDYVAKDMIKNIAAAWIITLPAAGIVSGITYYVIMKLS